MDYNKVLIISRYHDDIANPIYNAYIRGIKSQCKSIYFIDYFDQIGALGKLDFEKQIQELILKEKINLIFFIFVSGDPTLDPYFIQTIAINRFIAMVFWDTEQFFEQIDRYYAQLADLVILPANYEYIDKLKAIGINAICPFSLFDSNKYKPLKISISQDIDVSFIGEVTKGRRKEYIQYLKDNKINIQTYGNGTKNGKVSFEKVVEIFNRSKINLSFTGTYANDIYSFGFNINNRIRQNKGKPIEISLCGGFVLTQYVPGIEKVFKNGGIDTFLTKEELLHKIRHYLHFNEQRIKMASTAHKYAVNNYDSIIAFKKIFTIIRDITPKKNKILILDKIFIKIYTTFHVFYFITFLSQKRFLLALQELRIILHNKIFIIHDVKAVISYQKKLFFKRMVFRKSCNKLFKSLQNDPIVLYGAGMHTRLLLKQFSSLRKLPIKAIADKNSTLWGKKIHNIPIISPYEIENYAHDVVISTFAFEQESHKYLQQILSTSSNIYSLYGAKFTTNLVNQQTDPYQIFRDTLILD